MQNNVEKLPDSFKTYIQVDKSLGGPTSFLFSPLYYYEKQEYLL